MNNPRRSRKQPVRRAGKAVAATIAAALPAAGCVRASRAGMALAAWVVLTSCTTLSPYRNPAVAVDFDRPPGIGVHVAKVAFMPPHGEAGCAVELVQKLKDALQTQDIEVAPNVGAWKGGAVSTAVPPGLGSGKLVVALEAPSCETTRTHTVGKEERSRRSKRKGEDGEEEWYDEKYSVTVHTGSVTARVHVSAEAYDMETGVLVDRIDAQATESDSETGESLTFPSTERLERQVTEQVHSDLSRWLLHWTERAWLVFYDADECGMGATFSQLSAQDPEAALAAARDSIALCEEDGRERFRAAARYNAGMVHFRQGDHQAALGMLEEAGALHPNNTHIPKARAAVSRAMESIEIIERIRVDAASIAASDQGAEGDVADASHSWGRPVTPGRALIVERDGATAGSLVTLDFGAADAAPAVGTTGRLHVPMPISLFEGAVTLSASLGAGECEVVSVDGSEVVIRITKAGGRLTNTRDGSVAYTLPAAGDEIVFTPRG